MSAYTSQRGSKKPNPILIQYRSIKPVHRKLFFDRLLKYAVSFDINALLRGIEPDDTEEQQIIDHALDVIERHRKVFWV